MDPRFRITKFSEKKSLCIFLWPNLSQNYIIHQYCPLLMYSPPPITTYGEWKQFNIANLESWARGQKKMELKRKMWVINLQFLCFANRSNPIMLHPHHCYVQRKNGRKQCLAYPPWLSDHPAGCHLHRTTQLSAKITMIHQCQCLTGKQTAWAFKKYYGHHTLPKGIMEDLDNAQSLQSYGSLH
jgi:hypothetical protein